MTNDVNDNGSGAPKKGREKKLTRREKHIINKLKWKKKQINRNYYLKKKKEEKKRRKMAGDVLGYYSVVLTKDRRKVATLGTYRWSISANEAYNRFLEQNRHEVKFPKNNTCQKKQYLKGVRKVDNEILLVKTKDENYNPYEQPAIRDEDGKIMELVVSDNDRRIITRRDVWYVEETFSVTGFNPLRDRKDYTFILDNLIRKGLSEGVGKRVFTVKKALAILSDDGSIECVFCKTRDDAYRLNSRLEKDCSDQGVIFFGEAGAETARMIGEKFEERTGRPASSLLKR